MFIQFGCFYVAFVVSVVVVVGDRGVCFLWRGGLFYAKLILV